MTGKQQPDGLTAIITFRLTPSLKKELTAVAHEHYRNRADHLRWLVTEHIRLYRETGRC